MQLQTNAFGQTLGTPVPNWQPRPIPAREPIRGRLCRLAPLDFEAHGSALWEAFSLDEGGKNWTYLPYGPFADFKSFKEWLTELAPRSDTIFFAIVDENSKRAVGMGSYLNIAPAAGSVEVGHLHFSPLLQRTAVATEAMFLMMANAFRLGYRRYEWKCDSLNQPSRHAALRLGFRFEGIFRQAVVVKGRNRDTAWFSIIDGEWPALKVAYDLWLASENFDADGQQKASLQDFIASNLAK